MFLRKSFGNSKFLLVVAMMALLLASALVSPVHAQGTQPPSSTILVEMYEWGGSSVEVFEEHLRDQGLQSGDKVLLYAHGAFLGNVYDDTPFAQDLALSSGHTKLVAVGFPFTSLDWQLALGSETTEQARNVTNLVRAINRVVSTPPDAFCYSAGAVVCVKTLDQDVEYGRVVLAGKPFPSQISPAMRARAVNILNFWSDSDWFAVGMLSGGPIEGVDNYYRSGIAHTDWVQTMLNGQPNPLLQDYAKALKGEKIKQEVPTSSSGISSDSSLSPPPTSTNGGGGGGGDDGGPPTPNGGGAAVSTEPIIPPLFIPPQPPLPGPIVTQNLTNPFLLMGPRPTAFVPTLFPNPGGIDFSSLELRYFTEFPYNKSDGVGYAFKADLVSGNAQPIDSGQIAKLSSDAFFIWLTLPPQTFWVNLNPNEPDRIVDPELGKTDAGRIMLEADFQMKKTVAQLLHPDSESGQQFWDQVYGYIQTHNLSQACFSFRQWIVPGNVTVWASDDSIYILDAELDVKLESDYLELQGYDATPVAACSDVDPSLQEYTESLFRAMILPKLVVAVNTAPEYSDLRDIFYSRIVAEWYRDRHAAAGQSLFSSLIDQGNAANWCSAQAWDKNDIYDRYVQSIAQGEFNITRQSQQGNQIYTRTYFYGGVDFSDVPMTSITYSELIGQEPVVGGQIFDALFTSTGYFDSTNAWLGGTYYIGSPVDEATPPVSDSHGHSQQDTPELNISASSKPTVSVLLYGVGGLALLVVILVLVAASRRPRCPVCGTHAKHGVEFCPVCGTFLHRSEEQQDY